MKYSILSVALLFRVSLYEQDAPKPADVPKAPELTFHFFQAFLKIPRDMIMAEAIGVAINSKGHIFILDRGNHPMLEFDQEGNFISSFVEGSPIFHIPHSSRFDAQDNVSNV